MSKKPSKEFLRASKSVKLNRQLNKLDGNKRSRRSYQSLAAPIKDKISSINIFNKLLGRKRGTRKWSPTMESRKGKGTRKSMRRRRKTKKRKYRKNKKSRKNRTPRRYRKYGGRDAADNIPITPLVEIPQVFSALIVEPVYEQLTEAEVSHLLSERRLEENSPNYNDKKNRLENLTKESIKDLRYPSYNQRVNLAIERYNSRVERPEGYRQALSAQEEAESQLIIYRDHYSNDIKNYAMGILDGTVQG